MMGDAAVVAMAFALVIALLLVGLLVVDSMRRRSQGQARLGRETETGLRPSRGSRTVVRLAASPFWMTLFTVGNHPSPRSVARRGWPRSSTGGARVGNGSP